MDYAINVRQHEQPVDQGDVDPSPSLSSTGEWLCEIRRNMPSRLLDYPGEAFLHHLLTAKDRVACFDWAETVRMVVIHFIDRFESAYGFLNDLVEHGMPKPA
jgi:hypothetical protein